MLQLSPRVDYFYSRMKTHAETYLRQYIQECTPPQGLDERLAHIQAEIDLTGTYWQSSDELTYGAKLAWRNSTRCIGRLQWRNLEVCDMRHLTRAEDIFEACVEHLRLATNGGRIRPMITVFAPQVSDQPGIRIWNPQLIRYAGYRQSDGTILGDPAQVQLTDYLYALGWQRSKKTAFDILPLIIQMPGQPPKFFELPHDAILEVPLHHPEYSWFKKLGLKWHALPVISNMRLEIGGILYSAAPFNGWYMGTEIGARNLGDHARYNLLPVIAERLNLNMKSKDSLWKDRALVELNIAVLHSFRSAGVTIVDHHTASKQFMAFEEQERKAQRRVFGDWGWLVPPMSGSTMEVFHHPYENRILTPNFFYQPAPCPIADTQKVNSSHLCPFSKGG